MARGGGFGQGAGSAARGAAVDEPALLQALDSGKVAKGWLDCFRREPYDGPLRHYAQVLLTPHTSSYTRACRSRMETEAVINLLGDLEQPGR